MNDSPGGAAPKAAWSAALALLFAVVIGAAIGFALGRRPLPGHFKAPDADMSLIGSRAHLLDSLGLDPARRATIDGILDDAQRRADSVVSRMVGEVRDVAADARRRVRELLDARQQARFDSLLTSSSEMIPRSPLPPRG